MDCYAFLLVMSFIMVSIDHTITPFLSTFDDMLLFILVSALLLIQFMGLFSFLQNKLIHLDDILHHLKTNLILFFLFASLLLFAALNQC